MGTGCTTVNLLFANDWCNAAYKYTYCKEYKLIPSGLAICAFDYLLPKCNEEYHAAPLAGQ